MDSDEREFLRELVDLGYLSGAAAGIALQVADRGEKACGVSRGWSLTGGCVRIST
jgi:hypothetical protein